MRKVLSQRDLQNMLDRLENLAKSGAKDAAQALLQQLEQMMENLQMASPDMNGDDSDEMSELDELGDMIRQQQDLRDRTFKQGQNGIRISRARSAASKASPGRRSIPAIRWAGCSRTSRRCATGSTNCSKS